MLSERIRPNSECAPWVIDAIKMLERRLAQAEARIPSKCNGNHAGPRCADPECWNDALPLYVGWAVLAPNGNIRIWHKSKPDAEASKVEFGGELVMLTSIAPAEPAAMPKGFVLMPERLSAENGAKAALSGDFHVSTSIRCGCDDDPKCELCDSENMIPLSLPIGWPTIKAIYAKAVEMLGVRF